MSSRAEWVTAASVTITGCSHVYRAKDVDERQASGTIRESLHPDSVPGGEPGTSSDPPRAALEPQGKIQLAGRRQLRALACSRRAPERDGSLPCA
jgi:hypothetical protein